MRVRTRLETLNRKHDVRLLVNGMAACGAGGEFDFREAGGVPTRDISGQMEIYILPEAQ